MHEVAFHASNNGSKRKKSLWRVVGLVELNAMEVVWKGPHSDTLTGEPIRKYLVF
jgi:hypothetical protein